MRHIKFFYSTFSVTYLALMKDGNQCANMSNIDLPHYPFIPSSSLLLMLNV